MAHLYGDPVPDACVANLVERLQARGSADAAAAVQVCTRGMGRQGTAEDSRAARDAILLELTDWIDLDREAPALAAVRDRLARAPGERII